MIKNIIILVLTFFGLTKTTPLPPPMVSATPTPSINIPSPVPDFKVQFLDTDAELVKSYKFTSKYNGYGPHFLRVLEPNNPSPRVAHNFLYLLPADKENAAAQEDTIEILRNLNAQNQYNLTIILPSFSVDPWYADNPINQNYNYESFLVSDLQPWVKANLSKTGLEQHWLLGVSKSGYGAIDLLLRNPETFTLAAAWDFPAAMSSFDYGGQLNYGTDANFQNNYRLTPAFLEAHKTPFLVDNRIWISGYGFSAADINNFDKLLTTHGLAHTTSPLTLRAHLWGSGWIPEALSGLNQLSTKIIQ